MEYLGDFKGLHYTEGNYPDGCLRGSGVWRRRRVRRAVDRRMDSVPTQYLRHARSLDREIHGLTQEAQRGGERGPIEMVLERFTVEGLVFGSFNEMSASVERLLQAVATAAAQRWREMGARNYAHARSLLVTSLYRRWGAAAARANARLRIARLEHVGFGAGRRADQWGDAPGEDFAAPGALDDLAPDVGGGFGPGFA